MIGFLAGAVRAVGEEEALIDVAGVGYLVAAGTRTLSRLAPGSAAELHVETYVREDLIRLYGFLEEAERAWFVRLQSIQGVGAKASLAILDALGAAALEEAAVLGDASAFERAKGVGKKLAGRIAAELKDKPPPAGRGAARALTAAPAPAATASPAPSEAAGRAGAVSALLNLGYPETEARRAVAEAIRAVGGEDEGAIIKAALKALAP